MTELSRELLYAKLSPYTYDALEKASDYCRRRGNPYVEVAHWLRELLERGESDLHFLIRAYELDASILAADLTASLERLPRGATAVSNLSPHIDDAIERAWLWGSLSYGATSIRSAHLMLALRKSTALNGVLRGISTQFDRIPTDVFAADLPNIVRGSAEDGAPSAAVAAADAGTAAPVSADGKEATGMARYTVDMTAEARAGRLDPVIGREAEVRQIIDILMRRRQNNPILTGEAGVGKTAVVEGLARRIAAGDVPPSLQNVQLRSLDVGLLQAGAGVKGEFEQRLRQVIDEVQSSVVPVVLFIDEVHTLIGAGGTAGTGDAANLLKPALARGTLRTIGATTWREYKKYIEKDPALTRRFQVVKVGEPAELPAVAMLRGVRPVLERHHKVQILDEAIESAVRLAERYIADRQLPDKAVSLLDTACARVAVSHAATPPAVEDSERRLDLLTMEREGIAREKAVGIDVGEREQRVGAAYTAESERLESLRIAWRRERTLVEEILKARSTLLPESGNEGASNEETSETARAAARIRLAALQKELKAAQGDIPLVLVAVDAEAVASVVADCTGIPVGRMVKDEVAAVLNLGTSLATRVLGQDHALDTIAQRVQTARAGVEEPDKPIGVFMLAGPSGVGKTETAIALAEALYGGEQNMITINMSEFQEPHTVSTLKGAPPGYVGYGEGGVLTEAVRRRPFSVVLLDEIEKAHRDVHEIFFQVFDKGRMEDGEGRSVDFRNTLIILTTNVGTEMIMNLCGDPALMPDAEVLAKSLREPLLKVFPPALLGRLIVVPYYPLSAGLLERIVRLKIEKIRRRLGDGGVDLKYGDDLVKLVLARCNEPESGGRIVDAILTSTLMPTVSREFLLATARGDRVKLAVVRVEGEGIRVGVE